jgi:hypothetical protein
LRLVLDENSKRTRVEPVFGWLRASGGIEWPARLVNLAEGIRVPLAPGPLLELHFETEKTFRPSAARLAWMIRHAELLVPRDGRRWRELQARVVDDRRRQEVLARLDAGAEGDVPRNFILEGPTHADCLVECERAVLWIEGKRNDWLDPGTTWDVARDQLARNLEAVWLYATTCRKEFCLLICHEGVLKRHEQLLVDGYRSGTWLGGLQHLDETARARLSERIGTITWRAIVDAWPELRLLPELVGVGS